MAYLVHSSLVYLSSQLRSSHSYQANWLTNMCVKLQHLKLHIYV